MSFQFRYIREFCNLVIMIPPGCHLFFTSQVTLYGLQCCIVSCISCGTHYLGDDERLIVLQAALHGEAPRRSSLQPGLHQHPAASSCTSARRLLEPRPTAAVHARLGSAHSGLLWPQPSSSPVGLRRGSWRKRSLFQDRISLIHLEFLVKKKRGKDRQEVSEHRAAFPAKCIPEAQRAADSSGAGIPTIPRKYPQKSGERVKKFAERRKCRNCSARRSDQIRCAQTQI